MTEKYPGWVTEWCLLRLHGRCRGYHSHPAGLPCSCACHDKGDEKKVIPGKYLHLLYKDINWRNEYGSDAGWTRTPATVEDAEVVSSEIGGGAHAPVLDIDVPAYLVPSSTPGHTHLYIDCAMSWRQYKRLLRALANAGIIEKNYLTASLVRKHTAVRVPWVKKSGSPYA